LGNIHINRCAIRVHEAIVVAFEALLDGKDTISNPMVSAHLGIGGLIGILTALRLWIRMEIGTPDEAGNNPKIFSHVAKFVHFSFYAILILLPITGGFAWYQTSQSAADTHTILRAILLLLIYCMYLPFWHIFLFGDKTF
jgi:cytochrome b561